MKRNYDEMDNIFLNWDQCLLLKRVIFENFSDVATQEMDMACEIIHEINRAMEGISEKRNKPSSLRKEPENEISV